MKNWKKNCQNWTKMYFLFLTTEISNWPLNLEHWSNFDHKLQPKKRSSTGCQLGYGSNADSGYLHHKEGNFGVCTSGWGIPSKISPSQVVKMGSLWFQFEFAPMEAATRWFGSLYAYGSVFSLTVLAVWRLTVPLSLFAVVSKGAR